MELETIAYDMGNIHLEIDYTGLPAGIGITNKNSVISGFSLSSLVNFY